LGQHKLYFFGDYCDPTLGHTGKKNWINPLDWQGFKEALIRSYKSVNPKMVACNKLHLSHNGFVEEYAIEF
jgi:hypothetical protein